MSEPSAVLDGRMSEAATLRAELERTRAQLDAAIGEVDEVRALHKEMITQLDNDYHVVLRKYDVLKVRRAHARSVGARESRHARARLACV